MDPAAAESMDEIREQLIKASARIVFAVIIGILALAFAFWPKGRASVVQEVLVRHRRSVVKYKGEAPASVVQKALEAAIHAPNHFLNEPWRFRILGKQTVAAIIALNDAKKEVFEAVPGWMLVTIKPTAGDTKWNPKALEDHAAAACAVQNFMVTLAANGCASKWMTGAMGSPASKIMEACGVDESAEHFMGVIFFGVPAAPTADMAVPARKIGLAEPVVSRLP